MNKKKIIIILLVIVILLVGGYFLKQFIEKGKLALEEKGITYYDKLHNLYFFRENIDYVLDENNQRKYIEIDNKKYYEIANKEVIEDLVTENMLLKTSGFLNIRIINNQYYMKDYGRGLSGYYGTELKLESVNKDKLEYKALSKFCEIDSKVSYGSGCRNEKYYYIEKPFVLIKENGIWKVDEYTSVFEFEDSLIK